MRDKFKILTSVLIVLFLLSTSPAQAAEEEDVDLTVLVLGYPVADAGGPYSGRPEVAITFDSTGSHDPDGEIVGYAWNFGDGATGEGSTVSHTYDKTGSYTVTLTVTDDDDLTDTDTTKADISSPSPPPSPPPMGPSNKKPVADAGPDQAAYVNRTVIFSGVESHDPDGKIVSNRWDFGDGATASGVNVTHAYSEPGLYTVTLTVKDNKMAVGSDTCNVTVSEFPASPSVELSEVVPAGETDYVVNASAEADMTLTLNTTGPVTVTILRYHENPHPEDPLPATALPRFVDVSVSAADFVSWPIYMEMAYTDEEVEGLDEFSLGIYYWKNGTWQRCSDTGIDTERNVVWAYMTEEEASGSPILIGGMPAIPVPPLPPYISNLNITPSEVELGENVTISFFIQNMDSQSLQYYAKMQIGELSLLVEVELEAYESKMVTRTITPDEVGDYNVTVIGMTGSFMVKALPIVVEPIPATFIVHDLVLSSNEVEYGENVTVTVNIENVGEETGSHMVELKVDDAVAYSELVTLDGRESKTVFFTAMEPEGEHTTEVEGLTGSFTVKAPPPEVVPIWMRPGYVAGILIVIIAAAAILYAKWKGILPTFTQSLNSHLDNEKRTNRRNKV